MKNSQFMIDDLKVLAHQGEITDTNIPFNATQIRAIIRIILDLQGQIIDLENKTIKQLSDADILKIAENPDLWRNDGVLRSVIDFARAVIKEITE